MISSKSFSSNSILLSQKGGAQEVPAQRSQDFRVFSRAEVYERGTWTVAYVPEARSGADVATGRSYDLLRPDGRYELETEPTQSTYCFAVSHRYPEFAGEESYLGVAAYSVLMPGTNPVRPVSMFRNRGWRRGDDARFGDKMTSGRRCYGLARSLGHTWMPLPWRRSTPDSITGGMANTATATKGDSYDNALAESVIGLFKTEVIRQEGPWRGLEEVEFATLDWVCWYNKQRLLEPIGYIPPVELEQMYYLNQPASAMVAGVN